MTIVHRLAVVARECRGDLNNGEDVGSAARRAAVAGGLTVVANVAFAYVPHGLSIALLLAQSHLVISTWPEHRTATVDLAVCAEQEAAQVVWRELERYLEPTSAEVLAQTVNLTSLMRAEQGL
jgi:S-adenosylmethionine decarboxylase